MDHPVKLASILNALATAGDNVAVLAFKTDTGGGFDLQQPGGKPRPR